MVSKRVSSSNVNEVIRAVLNVFIFFYKKILHASKAPKAPKSITRTKSTKMQTSKRTKRK